jgi:hypothetical protein
MVQSKQLSAADYRPDGHHRETTSDPDLLNLDGPDIALCARRHHLHPNVWPWPPGSPSITARQDVHRKRFPESHDDHRTIVACNHEP